MPRTLRLILLQPYTDTNAKTAPPSVAWLERCLTKKFLARCCATSSGCLAQALHYSLTSGSIGPETPPWITRFWRGLSCQKVLPNPRRVNFMELKH